MTRTYVWKLIGCAHSLKFNDCSWSILVLLTIDGYDHWLSADFRWIDLTSLRTLRSLETNHNPALRNEDLLGKYLCRSAAKESSRIDVPLVPVFASNINLPVYFWTMRLSIHDAQNEACSKPLQQVPEEIWVFTFHQLNLMQWQPCSKIIWDSRPPYSVDLPVQ